MVENIDKTVEHRVTALEEGQLNLTKDLANLATTVDRMATSLSSAIKNESELQQRNYVELRNILADKNKPDWQVILMFIGILITLAGITLIPVWMTTSRNQSEYTKLNEQTKAYIRRVDDEIIGFEKHYYQQEIEQAKEIGKLLRDQELSQPSRSPTLD